MGGTGRLWDADWGAQKGNPGSRPGSDPLCTDPEIRERLGAMTAALNNFDRSITLLQDQVNNGLPADIDGAKNEVLKELRSRGDALEKSVADLSRRMTAMEQRMLSNEAEARGRWSVAKAVVSLGSIISAVVGWFVGTYIKP